MFLLQVLPFIFVHTRVCLCITKTWELGAASTCIIISSTSLLYCQAYGNGHRARSQSICTPGYTMATSTTILMGVPRLSQQVTTLQITLLETDSPLQTYQYKGKYTILTVHRNLSFIGLVPFRIVVMILQDLQNIFSQNIIILVYVPMCQNVLYFTIVMFVL